MDRRGPCGAGMELKRLKILVVDDHLDSREVLAELLASEGHEVITVASADLALEAARDGSPPDLIFLDYGMPGMTAAKFVHELKSSTTGEKVPVVLLTGMDEPDVPGVVGFVRKPVPFEKLSEIVARYTSL